MAARTGPAMGQVSSPFSFPRDYHFPAFYTRQTNLTTHHAQLTKWTAIILSYAKHHRIFRLSVSSAADSELFHNKRLDRRLSVADIKEVIDFMKKEGTAEYPSGNTNSAAGGDVVFLYWKRPEEWAEVVEKYVAETGQKGSVLTVYELTEGEGTRNTGKSPVLTLFVMVEGLEQKLAQLILSTRFAWHG